MQSLAPLLAVGTLWTIAVLTPGPNLLVAMRVSTFDSRAKGLICVAGIAVGTIIWGSSACLGVHAVLISNPPLYRSFKLFAAFYLIVLGLRLLLRKDVPPTTHIETPRARSNAAGAFGLGLLTCLTNVESVLFVASVFAMAMPQQPTPALSIAAVSLMAAISTTWYGTVAWFLTTPYVARRYERMRHWIDRVAAVLLVGFALKLLLGHS